MESFKLQKIAGVYGLRDPRSGRVMYIGASTNVEARYRSHLCSSSGGGFEKLKWVRELERAGLAPDLVLFEQTEPARLKAAEAVWVAGYRLLGEADFNVHHAR